MQNINFPRAEFEKCYLFVLESVENLYANVDSLHHNNDGTIYENDVTSSEIIDFRSSAKV